MPRSTSLLLTLALYGCHDGSSQMDGPGKTAVAPEPEPEPGETVEREGYATRRALGEQSWEVPVLVLEDGELVELILSAHRLELFDAHLGRRMRVRGQLQASAAAPRLVPSGPLAVLPGEAARVEPVEPEGRWRGPGFDEATLGFAGAIGPGGEGELTVFRGERALALRHTPGPGSARGPAELRVELRDHLDRIRDLVFVDADSDGELEVVILSEQMTGVGPRGAVPFTVPVVVDLEAGGLRRRPKLVLQRDGVNLAREVRAHLGAPPQPRDGLDAAWSCALRVDPSACAGPPVRERPWTRHALALARAGERSLPWTMAGLVALLGEGEPVPMIGRGPSASRRWRGLGEWLEAEPEDPGEPKGRVATSWEPARDWSAPEL